MTKIYMDYGNSEVVSNLQTASNELGNASKFQCNIPSDFKYYTKLKNCLTDIATANKNVASLNAWYQNSKKDLENLESELCKSSSSEVFKVTKKEQFIK